MSGRNLFVVASVALGLVSVASQGPDLAAAPDPHAYFNTLVARKDFFKGYSLRPQPGAPVTSPHYERQLDGPREGGYNTTNDAVKYVTYDAAADAARVLIPGWLARTTLAEGINATDTKVTPAAWEGWVVNKQIKIDDEIMVITAVDSSKISPRTFTVSRAQYGTSAVRHAAGATIVSGANSLPNRLGLPLGTEDGHTYVFTWDVLFTSSFVNTGLAGNKTFQFTSGGDNIWLEIKTRMDGGHRGWKPAGFDPKVHVASIDVRSYNNLRGVADWRATDGDQIGPGVVTNNTPLLPMAGTFSIYPNRWTRYWVRIEQRANDYDYFDLWVADESQEPVQIYSRIPISVRPPDFSIKKFWVQFNDSQAITTPERTTDWRDLVAYVRNLAAIRYSGDMSSLLLRPLTGAPPPVTSARTPGRPGNLRIVRGN
jgi:hypothetical protein